METRCGTDGVALNRRQLQSLLTAQRAIQNSISTIIDVLQDSSKLVHHQPCPQDVMKDSAAERSLARQSGRNSDSNHFHEVCNTASINAEARNDVASRFPGARMFDVENARARKMYFGKRKLSLDMYNRAGASHLSREYHYQCEYSMSFRFEL